MVSESPWLTIKEGAQHGKVAPKQLYREIKAGRLRAARVGGRKTIRLRREWIDQWLESTAAPVEVR